MWSCNFYAVSVCQSVGATIIGLLSIYFIYFCQCNFSRSFMGNEIVTQRTNIAREIIEYSRANVTLTFGHFPTLQLSDFLRPSFIRHSILIQNQPVLSTPHIQVN